MWEKLRSGDWLDEERLRVYPAMLLLLTVACVAAVLMTATGRFDANGHPLGTDFSQVWVAGLETLRGHPEAPFDLERHITQQRAEFGADSDVYGWHYPPFFLAPAARSRICPISRRSPSGRRRRSRSISPPSSRSCAEAPRRPGASR